MRALRAAMASVAWLALVAGFASATGRNDGDKEKDKEQKRAILKFAPAVKGSFVEYDKPVDDAAIDACQFTMARDPFAYVLRDGQGKLLRRFTMARPGSKNLDTFSYYQDGFEVYREVDLDGDKFIDEARWMNGGGTRVALIKPKANVIASWKRISAEEASKVMVLALVSGSAELAETVLATPEELAALGVPAPEVERVRAAGVGRAEAFLALRKGLAGWTGTTTWLRLDAAMPHLIPADAATGLTDDLTLYENAIIIPGQAGGGGSDKLVFLEAGEIVKVGDGWKFVDLPRTFNPAGNQPVVAIQGGIRSAIYHDSGPAAGDDPEVVKAIAALAQYDEANAAKYVATNKRDVAAAYVGKIAYIRAVEKLIRKPEEKLAYGKQVIETVGNAYQTGNWPEGLKALNLIEEERGPLASFAAYRRLNAEYTLENENPGVNLVAVQKKWMADMKDFLAKYEKADEVPEVLFQLGSNSEFNGEDKDARAYYGQLSGSYPETLPGKRAAGALRRLDLVGQSMTLKATSIDGKAVDLDRYRGKTTLVIFWGAWASPVQRDMPELVKVYEKDRSRGFEVIGINLDADLASCQAFLKAVPQPWPTVFEPGGLDGRLAVDYGIMTNPTMILIDAQGKVVNRFVRSAADLDVQLDKLLAAKPSGGVALGVK